MFWCTDSQLPRCTACVPAHAEAQCCLKSFALKSRQWGPKTWTKSINRLKFCEINQYKNTFRIRTLVMIGPDLRPYAGVRFSNCHSPTQYLIALDFLNAAVPLQSFPKTIFEGLSYLFAVLLHIRIVPKDNWCVKWCSSTDFIIGISLSMILKFHLSYSQLDCIVAGM